MKRGEFIVGLGSAAAAWPVVARAQQPERVRRIGVLGSLDENDSEEKLRLSARTRWRTWVGPMAAMCGWTFGGAAVTQ